MLLSPHSYDSDAYFTHRKKDQLIIEFYILNNTASISGSPLCEQLCKQIIQNVFLTFSIFHLSVSQFLSNL